MLLSLFEMTGKIRRVASLLKCPAMADDNWVEEVKAMVNANKGEDRLRSRFQKGVNKLAGQFIASIPFDHRLYKQDIAGSIAHAQMLAKQGIIPPSNAELIVSALKSIRGEIDQMIRKLNAAELIVSAKGRYSTVTMI